MIRKTVGLSSGHLHPHPAQKHKPWFVGKEVFKQSGNLHWRRLQLVFGESGLCLDPNDAASVQTIIAMAEILWLNVIAEWVENEAQHEFMGLRGCRAYQRYLFGRPVPIEQFEALLKQV